MDQVKEQLQSLVGHTEEYGPLNSSITVHIVTTRGIMIIFIYQSEALPRSL